MASSGSTERDEFARQQPSETDSTLAKALAPEDIRRGDYVSLLDEVYEVPTFFWSADPATLPVDQLVRLRCIAPCGGIPLRVKRVCLPFVLVKSPGGEGRSLDVRKCRLARLQKTYARPAWKAFKKVHKKSRGRSRNSC